MTPTMTKQTPLRGPAQTAQPTPEEREQKKKNNAATMLAMRVHGAEIRGQLRQHIVNQDEMILAATMAVLTGLRIYFLARPGLGKTLVAKTLMQIMGVKGVYICLNPEITPSKILGMTKLNLKNYELDFVPGVFDKGNKIVFIDEMNRGSDQAQTALLEPLDSKQVTIDGISRPASDILTVLTAGNLDEDGGTRMLISALWDRIDCVVPAAPMTEESVRQAIDFELRPKTLISPIFDVLHEDAVKMNGHRPSQNAEAIIRKYRATFEELQASVEEPARATAAFITNAFSDSTEWRIGATYRTATAMINTALALSILENADLPRPSQVWKAARWCLGGLEPRNQFLSTAERLGYIYSRIDALKAEVAEHTRHKQAKASKPPETSSKSGRKRR